MKRFERWGLVATLALGLLAVALALARINRPPQLAGEDELRASLAALEDAITIQWYASEPAEFTGERRAIPRAVQRIEEVCGVRVQRIEPLTDPAQAAHAARLGLTPLRLRTIERDGWSETSLWSSLRVISARHGAWTCLRLGPEEAPELAVRMAAGLRQLRQPERARIGLRLPPEGFAKLEAELAQRAELFLLGQAARADVPAEIDWLLWAVSPTDGPAEAAALERHLARGGNLLLLAAGGATPSSADALLFSTCGAELSADSSGTPARSTANSQDFQPLGMQPNGTLYFGTAARLAPRSTQTSAHRWHALASDAEANVRLALVQPPEREPGGTAVLCASTAPFSDAHWSDPLLAHQALLRVLELQGTDPSRARLSRLSAAPVENPIELSSAQRTWLRILTVLLLPLALAIAGIFVLRRTTGRTRLGSLSLVLVLGLALLAALPRPGASTHPALAARRDRLVQAAPLELDWHVSERERLPAAWRAALDDWERELKAFSDSAEQVGRGVRLRIERHPAIDAQQRAKLESAGIPSAWVSESDGDREAAREIVATLEIRSGSRKEQLHFHFATELNGARFRLGFALERLVRGASAGGGSVRIALQSPLTRLSPAEAQLQYLDRGLFAPGGNDPYLQARAFLTAQGFELLRIPEQELSGDFRADLLVILQPRRPSQAEQAAFARALERGIPGIIGAQHFMAQSRTRGSDPRRGGWWPQPQFLDLDQGFFAELGLRWRRELLFDQQCARAETWSVLDTGSTRTTERMQLSNAWFPRVAGDGLAPARMISVGALSMPQATELEFDAARASSRGYEVTPLLQSSPATWTADWQGGELDPGLLGEQPDSKIRGARSLGLRFEAKPGTGNAGFLALGCARSFEDGELFRAETDNANALLEWCARATLPADLCALLADRARGAGLAHVQPLERVRLRALVLAGPLVLLLAAFLAWRRWRA